jgi:hypothetical protein
MLVIKHFIYLLLFSIIYSIHLYIIIIIYYIFQIYSIFMKDSLYPYLILTLLYLLVHKKVKQIMVSFSLNLQYFNQYLYYLFVSNNKF